MSKTITTTFHAVAAGKQPDGTPCRLCLDQAPVGHVYGPDYWTITDTGHGKGYKTRPEAEEAVKHAYKYGPGFTYNTDQAVFYVLKTRTVEITEEIHWL